eukprot:52269-Eustigmatos_ZCMA.PRE.1
MRYSDDPFEVASLATLEDLTYTFASCQLHNATSVCPCADALYLSPCTFVSVCRTIYPAVSAFHTLPGVCPPQTGAGARWCCFPMCGRCC